MDMRLTTLFFTALLATSSVSSGQFTERVSVVTGGLPHGSSVSSVRVSDNGRFVVYSTRDAAVPEDTNDFDDVYLHDRSTGITELVSRNPAGLAGNGRSFIPVVDADGSTVAFFSLATDLVPGIAASLDVYALDRNTGVMEVLNVDSNGVHHPSCLGTGAQSDNLEISADGRFVYFPYRSNTLAPGLTLCTYYGFVRDRLLGLTTVETFTAAGAPSYARDLDGSDDGKTVVWQSTDPNVLPGSNNFHHDIYVRDTVSGQVRTVNLSNQGVWANDVSLYPSISGDGQRVAFLSYADNLVPGDTNGEYDAFVYDIPSLTIEIASVSTGGVLSNKRVDWALQISKDGNRVAFATDADNLVAGDTNGEHDVFVRDLAARTTVRVSEGTGGLQSAFDSFQPDLDFAGGRAVFANTGGDLVPGAPPTGDWYLNDLDRTCPAVLAYCTAKTNSAGCTPEVSFAGVPILSGNVAFFATAREVLSNQAGLFFWGLAPNSAPFVGGTRCVAAPLVRTPVQASGGSPAGSDCTGSYSYAFDTAVMNQHGLTAGTTVYGQFWSLDPGSAPPFGLTDGLRFTLCP